jgi:hypothetical protein
MAHVYPRARPVWRAARTASLCLTAAAALAVAPSAARAEKEIDAPGADASLADTYDLDDYELDGTSRAVSPRGRLRCPEVDLVRYRGAIVRYSGALRVHPAFKERLQLFEEVVREVAIEVYGRAPRRIVHLGSYNCRRIRRFPDMMSEHGLGNALDVAGFDFGRATKGTALPAGVPRKLRRPFKVRVLDHWRGKGKIGAVHARFLHTLGKRLIERKDIFRVLLGPAWPGHDNHFHFDCSNYRLVAIFESDPGVI